MAGSCSLPFARVLVLCLALSVCDARAMYTSHTTFAWPMAPPPHPHPRVHACMHARHWQAFFEYKESGVKAEPDMIVAFCASHASEARRKRHWKMRFTRRKPQAQ